MELEDYSTQELHEELERRAQAAHEHRQSRVYRGEIEDSTDGDQHIEDNGGIFHGKRLGGRGS